MPAKIAAQRAAAPGLELEAEDARWGIDSARERKRADDDAKKSAAAAVDAGAQPALGVGH